MLPEFESFLTETLEYWGDTFSHGCTLPVMTVAASPHPHATAAERQPEEDVTEIVGLKQNLPLGGAGHRVLMTSKHGAP